MDIIDILVAKSITPQGQMEGALVAAQQAARDALEAKQIAIEAQGFAETAEGNAADYASAAADSAAEAASSAASISSAIDTAIDELQITLEQTHTPTSKGANDYYGWSLNIDYPSGNESTINNIIKLYTTEGSHEDGSMTQAAITGFLAELWEDNFSLEARISNLEEHGTGGGSTNLGSENAGKIVAVGDSGYIRASDITEEDLIKSLIASGVYEDNNIIGIEIDYTNKTFTRLQGAVGLEPGPNFNSWKMYSQRQRCVIDFDNHIVAKFGDADYLMEEAMAGHGKNTTDIVYQPKFYYMRVPIIMTDNSYGGKTIRKEQLYLSDTPKAGFKIHPAFVDANGDELDYILISTFEGNNAMDYRDEVINDFNDTSNYLQSIISAKPISGENKNFTIENAEKLAQNRGAEWHITDLEIESLNQMLMLVEFGTLNAQAALELGSVSLPNTANTNCAAQTGSTSLRHNDSGAAEETYVPVNGTMNVYTDVGKRCVSYRGFENPWGNIWRMVGGAQVLGISSNESIGGHLLKKSHGSNFNSGAFTDTGIKIPNSYDWISGFNYISEYDWLFIPAESTGANSALPVGDSFWVTPNNRQANKILIGGAWSFGDVCGPFCYAFDTRDTAYSYACSARLMFIPDKTQFYYSVIKNTMEQDFIK